MPEDHPLSEKELLNALAQSVLHLDVVRTGELAQMVLDRGYSARSAILDGLSAGMRLVGDKFCNHEYFVPEVLVAARAMYRGLNLLKPRMLQEGSGASSAVRGKIAVGVVQGDLHDIGKNIVRLLLEAEGFTVTDLGKNVPAENIADQIAKEGVEVVGLSTLMTTTLRSMEQTVAKIRLEHPGVKVMIGGAPVTENFSREIGADGTAPDAVGAVKLTLQLLAGS
jgi:methanogenic corrinoid protein MtbC1